MARDDDKLLFSTAWDIDQIFRQDETEITVSAGATLETTVETFDTMGSPVWMDFVYKVAGGDYWWQPGGLSTPTTADFEGVAGYIRTTATSAIVGLVNGSGSSKTVTVRYRVYTDVLV